MTDFFDQNTGNETEDFQDVNSVGATALINGSNQPLEVGSSVVPALQALARQAGYGKFKVWMNGTEVKPSAIKDSVIRPDDRFEIRPFDEAG